MQDAHLTSHCVTCGAAMNGRMGFLGWHVWGLAYFDIADQAMAVVHQDLGYVAESGFVAFGFFVQPRIGIAATGVAVVAAALTLEVDLRVAPRQQRPVLVFALKCSPLAASSRWTRPGAAQSGWRIGFAAAGL